MPSHFPQSMYFHGDIDETPWMAHRRKRSSLSPSSSAPSSPDSTTPESLEIPDRQLESDSYFYNHSSPLCPSPGRIVESHSGSLPRRSVVSFRKKGNQVYSSPYNNAPAYQVRSFDGELTPYHQPIHLPRSNVSMDYRVPSGRSPLSPLSSQESSSKLNFDFSQFITQAALNAQPRRRTLSFAKYRKKSTKQSPPAEQIQRRGSASNMPTRKSFSEYFRKQDSRPSPPSTTNPATVMLERCTSENFRVKRKHTGLIQRLMRRKSAPAKQHVAHGNYPRDYGSRPPCREPMLVMHEPSSFWNTQNTRNVTAGNYYGKRDDLYLDFMDDG